MFRTWTWWFTLLILAVTLGYFSLLSHEVRFTRVGVEKAATVPGKK